MSVMITGTVIKKKDEYVYLDTTGDGQYDKVVSFCDDRFTTIVRYCNAKFPYRKAYTLIKPKDKVSIPVNLPEKKAQTVHFVNPLMLDGEIVINGNLSYSLYLCREMRHTQSFLAQDKAFTFGR